MNKLPELKVNFLFVLAFAFVVAIASASAYAHEEMVRVELDMDGSMVSLDCPKSGASQIEPRYEACKSIFDNEGEEQIAIKYCKPLAIAQACTGKPVAQLH